MGKECFTGKYQETEQDKVKIVICNGKVARREKIREGRYDLEVVPMKKGVGFIVVFAKWAFDDVQLVKEQWRIVPIFNGKEQSLKTEDNRFIPLAFDCENYYDPAKIVPSLKRKLVFMQLNEEFDEELFYEAFLQSCALLEKEYEIHVKSKFKK